MKRHIRLRLFLFVILLIVVAVFAFRMKDYREKKAAEAKAAREAEQQDDDPRGESFWQGAPELTVELLMKHTGRKKAEITKALSYDNFMNAKEAIQFGLCDRIVDGPERVDPE